MKIIDKKNHLVNLINQFDSNKNIFQNIATESTDYIFYMNLPVKIQNKRFNIILPYVNLNGKLVLDVETFFTANGFNNVHPGSGRLFQIFCFMLLFNKDIFTESVRTGKSKKYGGKKNSKTRKIQKGGMLPLVFLGEIIMTIAISTSTYFIVTSTDSVLSVTPQSSWTRGLLDNLDFVRRDVLGWQNLAEIQHRCTTGEFRDPSIFFSDPAILAMQAECRADAKMWKTVLTGIASILFLGGTRYGIKFTGIVPTIMNYFDNKQKVNKKIKNANKEIKKNEESITKLDSKLNENLNKINTTFKDAI